MEAQKKPGLIPRLWHKGGVPRALLIAVCLLLAAAVIAAAVWFIGFFSGENVLLGTWKYEAKITSYGDIDSVFSFAEDGKIYIQSTYGVTKGTYTLLKGGPEGSFVTDIAGEKIQYDYTQTGDTLIIQNTSSGYSMTLTRVS